MSWKIVSRPLTAAALLLLSACISTRGAPPPAPRDKDPNSSSQVDIPEPDVQLGKYRLTRQISMFYRLDLRRDNAHAQQVAATMRLHDSSVRDCYIKRLDDSPQLRGNVEISFALSKAAQSFKEINQIGGTIHDKSVVGCLKQRIAAIPIDPPHDIQGTLNFTFSYTVGRPLPR